MANKPSVGDQVVSGLRLAGLVVLACVTGTLFVWGALVVSHEVAGSVVMGWAALAVALVILLLNLNGWARMLPAFLALAALKRFSWRRVGTCSINLPSRYRGVWLWGLLLHLPWRPGAGVLLHAARSRTCGILAPAVAGQSDGSKVSLCLDGVLPGQRPFNLQQ